jgi:hypothetical protein
MKTIITLLLVTNTCTNSFAQWQNKNDNNEENKNDQNEMYGNRRNEERYDNNQNNNGRFNNTNSALLVNGFSQNRYLVSIDNNYQNQNNTNNVITVGSLSSGNHNIIIYELKASVFGSQRQEQIYSSVLYFKQGIETIININFNGQVSINERQIIYNGNNGSNGNNGNGYGYGKKWRKHRRCNDDGQNNYPMGSGYGYNQQMNEYDFNNMKQFVQKESFDDRRMNIAKQAADRNYFSTTQVKSLMNIFSFDEGKLELAKYFYSRTTDRNNYYQLTDALTFGMNKDALLQYIRNGR